MQRPKKKPGSLDLCVAWAQIFELINNRLKELEIPDAHVIAARAADALAKEGANGDNTR
jgi:hypothetical protein